MTSTLISAAWRPYLCTLAETALDVASVGAWTAAGELAPARRRLARATVAAVNASTAIPEFLTARATAHTAEPATPSTSSTLPYVDAGITLPVDETSEAGPSPRRRAVLAAAVGAAALTTAVAVSVGGAIAGRHLQRRWLARLTRHGHSHPHRALPVRMAVLYAVMVVPSRVHAVRERTEAARRDAEPAADGKTTFTG